MTAMFTCRVRSFCCLLEGRPFVSCSPARGAVGIDLLLPEVRGVWHPHHVCLRQAVVVVVVPSGQVHRLAEV